MENKDFIPSLPSLNIILLAAGMSRRMGEENKLLLPFGDSTILETTLSNILKADIGKIYVVIGHESDKIEAFLSKKSDILIIKNPDYAQGMLTSIQAGVSAISDFGFRISENEQPKSEIRNPKSHYMICLSDMPLITPDEYRLLAHSFLNFIKNDEKAIVQPVFQGERGNPVLFSYFYKNDILNLPLSENTEGCRPIVQANKQHLKLVEMPTSHILRDVDKKEDYLNILK